MDTLRHKKTQVIAIAMEAADMQLIEKWCKEDKLPNLQNLRKKGTWRKLTSTADVASGGTWPTLHTGSSPAKHGIARSHRHLKTGTYQIHKQYANEVKVEPFWMNLSRQGKRCAIIDVPKSFPKENFNGIHFVNWGDEHQTWKQSSWPVSFSKEIIKKFGEHPLAGWYQQRPRNKEDYADLANKLLTGIRTRTQLACYVLKKEPWDLFLLSYSELHWAGHVLWHTMDAQHPDHTAELAEDFGDAMLKCYQAMDAGIAEILACCENPEVLIFSNSGMGPNYSGRHLVSDVLKKLGMSGDFSSKKSTKRKSLLSRLPARRWGSLAFEKTEKFIPIPLIEAVKKVIPERLWDTWTRKLLYSGNNWKDSIAFSIPSDYSGTIRINLQGREPNGKVKPGKEYDEVCEKIMNAFAELRNPITGKKTIERVIKVRDSYKGDYVNELPDIVVTWKRDAPIEALSSPKIGTITGKLTDKRSGGHQSYGFLLMTGKSVPENQEMEEAHIMDIAATITSLLGVAVPPIMDGKILPELKPVSY